jgi:hypothetical protein
LAVLALGASAILLALLSQPAGAAKAKPKEKLYTISLATTVQVATTESGRGSTPPYGCKGEITETFRYAASAHTSPVPTKLPVLKHGRFRYFDFPGPLAGLSASLTEDVTGGWTLDPTLPYPPDPSACAFQPTHTVGQCELNPGNGTFLLFPYPGDGGKFTLTYEGTEIIRACPPVSYAIPARFFEEVLIPLQVNSVLALRRHRSVHAAGTVTQPLVGPLTSGPIGQEVITYAIKITRVR